MKKSSFVILALLTLVAGIAAQATPPSESATKFGFLFSVRKPDCGGDDACLGQFVTRLLIVEGDHMRVALQTPHLYVPRSTGFWELGALVPKSAMPANAIAPQQNTEDDTAQDAKPFAWQLWAAPIGKVPVLPQPSSEADSDSQDTGSEIYHISLIWVGTNHLSVIKQIGEYSEPHEIVSIDSVARNAPEGAWKPSIPQAVYDRDFADCIDEKSDFNTRSFLEGANQGWSISRGKLRWEFAWTFSYDGGAARGYATGCPTSLRPPKDLVGDDALGVGWNQVLSKVPDAVTAFSSPDHSLVVVITRNQVLALRREGSALANPSARVFLPSGEILSAQWAIGKHADAWAEQLTQAKSWIDAAQN